VNVGDRNTGAKTPSNADHFGNVDNFMVHPLKSITAPVGSMVGS
jgi:hypothetical protein